MANIVYYEDIQLVDNVKLIAGTSSDIQIYTDNSNNILDFYNLSNVIFRQHFLDGDMTFQCDDGSGGVTTYFKLDGGDTITRVARNFRANDNVALQVGVDGDAGMYHDGTNTYFQNDTGNLILLQNTNDGDIIFKSDDGSGGTATYFFLDGSAEQTKFNKNTEHQDDVQAQFGTSSDLKIYHSAGASSYIENSSGNFYIMQRTNDGDMYFQCDDGSGGDETYFFLDGSQSSIKMKKTTTWDDNIKAMWGNDDDIQIYSNNTTAYIEMPNLSNFVIGDSTSFSTGNIALVRVAELTGTKSMEEDWMGMYTSANSGLSYMTSSGTVRFNTTNSGAAVTGNLTATGDVEDRDIPCVLTSTFSDDSSTTSYLFMPFNNNSESSSNQYYNYFAAPQAGKVVSIMLMHVSGSMSSSFTTQLRVTKNGSAANTSGELTPSNGTSDGSYVEYAPGTTFAKGDRLQFSYQKSAGGKYWRGATATIVIELTDYDI